MTDRLEQMLESQLALQRDSMGVDPLRLNVADRIEFIRTMTLALISELNEALEETSWKPWARGDYVREDAYFGELIDAWHFLMNLLLVAYQVEPPELARIITTRYHAKREVNARRQRDGYDGLMKCHSCGRALDDEYTIVHRGLGEHLIGAFCVCGSLLYSVAAVEHLHD